MMMVIEMTIIVYDENEGNDDDYVMMMLIAIAKMRLRTIAKLTIK